MPGVVAAVGVAVLSSFGAAAASAALIMAVGAATIGFVTYSSIRGAKMRDGGRAASNQQILLKSTSEPRKIVYGQAVISGPIAFMNTSGSAGVGLPKNGQLYCVVALTGHEIDSFQGFYLDDKWVPISEVDTAGDGHVTTDGAVPNGHGYAPFSGAPVLYLRGHLGAAGQTVDTMVDGAFSSPDLWTSNHRGRGIAYFVARLDQVIGSEAWASGSPANLSALIKGKKVYDPRLDSTFSGTWGAGSGAHRVATPSTWAYSSNPALCLADYLIDDDLGAGEDFDPAYIDYNSVAFAADDCDHLVAVPTAATEKRFTINGVLSCGEDHRPNIEKILSSMAGTLRYYNGLWRIAAGVWPTSSSFTLTQSDLIGDIEYRPQPERTERYNAIRGLYFDPTRRHKESAYLPVEDAALQSNRDASLVIWKDLDLPMTNSETMCQRIAMRAVEQASRTGLCVFPMGYRGMDIAPGDRGTVTISELGWSGKAFRCIGIRHVDLVGAELVLKEDDSAAYDDPAEGEYGTRSAASVITFPRFRRTVTEENVFDDFLYISADELHRRWTKRQGGVADADISLLTGLTDVAGGNAVRFGNNSGNDEWWGALTDVLLPYDPNSTYEVGLVVRRTSGSGLVYCGVEGVANDRATMVNTSGSDSYSGQHYVAAAGAAPGSSWTTYRGYLRGHGSTPTSPSNDPSTPSVARTNVTFIRPMLLVNYTAQAGQMDVAALWLRRAPYANADDFPSGYYASKPSTTSRDTTTTYTDDPHLVIPDIGPGAYRVAVSLVVYCENSGEGMKARINHSGTFTIINGAGLLNNVPAGGTLEPLGPSTAAEMFNTLNIPFGIFGAGYVTYEFLISVTVTGTLSVQWAQNTSSADDTRMVQGSYLQIQRRT